MVCAWPGNRLAPRRHERRAAHPSGPARPDSPPIRERQTPCNPPSSPACSARRRSPPSLLAPRPAQALDFTFTFTTDGSGTGGAGQTVAGTLSGLVDGNNAGPGVTAAVTQSPETALDGTYTFDTASTSGDAFTVSGGNITFASAAFLDSGNDELDFGSAPASKSTFFPQLINGSNLDEFQNQTMPDTFAPASVAAVPEPSPIAPFAIAGLGLLGLTLRARRQKKAA